MPEIFDRVLAAQIRAASYCFQPGLQIYELPKIMHEETANTNEQLQNLRDGDSEAAGALWDKFFDKLVATADSTLRTFPTLDSGEDVALSALHSVIHGLKENISKYAGVCNRESLSRILVTITRRKAIDAMRFATRDRRDSRKLQPLNDVPPAVDTQPSHEDTVAFAEEYNRLMGLLRSDELRRVAELKLSGCTNLEIATKIGRAERTVRSKMELIRLTWSKELD
jgi:DNA-directed RNA polymerase specialized sigma24 family protein